MKDAAKRGDDDVCRTLAKEVVRARKAITRIHTSKAHLNSVQYQMKAQLGMLYCLSLIFYVEYLAYIKLYLFIITTFTFLKIF